MPVLKQLNAQSTYTSNKPDSSKILLKCRIARNFFSFDGVNNGSIFPDAYASMSNKLVLIYLDKIIDRKFTLRSERKFQNMVEPYLPPKVSVKFPGSKRSRFFRPDEILAHQEEK